MLMVTAREGSTLVSGRIENQRELDIAQEAIGRLNIITAPMVHDVFSRDTNGINYRYQALEIGSYVTWMVR